jgi:agmatinase
MPKSTDLAFTAQSNKGNIEEHTYAGALSFLRRRYSKDLSGVDVAVVGVPFDLATTNRPGARFGPAAIRAASAIMAWDRPYGWDYDPRERLSVVDYGDVSFDFAQAAQIPGAIEEQIATIVAAGAAPLSLGGDHWISLPALRAVHRAHGPLSLVHFDAHTDTWEDEPGRLYHHGTMFRHAANDGLIVPERSVQIGIRTHNPDTMGFHIQDAPRVHAGGTQSVIDAVRELTAGHKVYLTFDIDCLDPAFAPGTGTPVSGGLSSAQAISILCGLAGIDVVGADVVEVAPAYDSAQMTALAAAHIGFLILGLYGEAPRRRAAARATPEPA